MTGPDEADAHAAFVQMRAALSERVVGLEELKTGLLVALLTNGHLLVEGTPGTAKTRSVRALADMLHADFGRIQFTPDLLPSDITGTQVMREHDGHRDFVFDPGPVFNNIVLADEINRAPPKVQSALLEAMEERQVTVLGETHALPDPFLVLATQNPLELEGTYPLPEAQLDRFLLKVHTRHPTVDEERQILHMLRNAPAATVAPSFSLAHVIAARAFAGRVHVSDHATTYLVDLVQATRRPVTLKGTTGDWLLYGASTRGTIALERVAQALAWLDGRDHVTPDDIRTALIPALSHRVAIGPRGYAEGVTPQAVLGAILDQTAAA